MCEFTFIADLKSNWRTVRSEFDSLDETLLVPSAAQYLYNGDTWHVGWIKRYFVDNEPIRARCPVTSALVDAFPDIISARYSCMEPGARVRAHRGVQAFGFPAVRLHLGLRVPRDCGISIGGVVRTWEEGECFVFDDSIEHFAWNASMKRRVVLIVDFRAQDALPLWPAAGDAGSPNN